MKKDGTFMVVYADGRLLLTAAIEGAAANVVDVLVDDSDEADQAIAIAFRAVRRQIVKLLVQEAK